VGDLTPRFWGNPVPEVRSDNWMQIELKMGREGAGGGRGGRRG